MFRNVAWVRVSGKGCFQTSPQLREFAEQIVASGEMNLVVDLEDCPMMDSTFMGTLSGIARCFVKSGRFQIVNLNPRNLGSLRNLGLDQILDVDCEGVSWTEERALVRQNVTRPLDEVKLTKAESAEMVLEAHEELCRANAENKNRFRDVIEYLKKDLEEPGEAGPKA